MSKPTPLIRQQADLFEASDGDTVLSDDEKEGLIPSWITTRGDLNAAEQAGVIDGERWEFGRKHKQLLTETFARQLHKKMFTEVWRWAGQFRNTDKNIGVPKWEITSALKILLDDTRFQIERATFPPDEIAARFHHRLVQIHPFPNGNGRHARLMADVLITHLGQPRFSWGRLSNIPIEETRKRYLAALREADARNLSTLVKFVRS